MKTLTRTMAAFLLSLLAASALANQPQVSGTVKSVDFDQRTLTIVDDAGQVQRFSFDPSVKTIINGRNKAVERTLEAGQTVELKLKPQDNLESPTVSMN